LCDTETLGLLLVGRSECKHLIVSSACEIIAAYGYSYVKM
jgi:hypothetical protein